MTRVQIWNNTIVKKQTTCLIQLCLSHLALDKLHNTGGTNIHGSFHRTNCAHPIPPPSLTIGPEYLAAGASPKEQKSVSPALPEPKRMRPGWTVMVPQVWNLSISRSSCLPWPQWLQVPCWNLCPTIHTKSSFSFSYAFHFVFKLPILNSGPFAWDPNICLTLVSLMGLEPRFLYPQ